MTQPMPVPLTAVLSHAATEVLRLSQIAGQIDTAFGSLDPGPGCLPAETLQTLQSADLLRQSLECLACYLDALARSAEPGIALSIGPALDSLPLRGLAEALQGRPPNTHAHTRASPEAEFF